MAKSFTAGSQVFDEIRSCWVAATPEEVIRQLWLRKMVLELGFPKELIAVEKELKSFPHLLQVSVPDRRIDIVCYGKTLEPLLLIECKAVALSPKALDQAMGYNDYVKAPYVAVANDRSIYLRHQGQDQTYELSYLPPYANLMEKINV